MSLETNPATGLKFPVITCGICQEAHHIVFDANTEVATCFKCSQEVYVIRVSRDNPPLPKATEDLLREIDPAKVSAYLAERQAELDREKALLEDIAGGDLMKAEQDYWMESNNPSGNLVFHRDAIISSISTNTLTALRKD